MQKLTYRQAYDKIIEAYFKDEIKPLRAKFCFCGTLCDNTYQWALIKTQRTARYMEYSGWEYGLMESALMQTMRGVLGESIVDSLHHPKYEDALFAGMCAALEVLKQIHRERGENVDEEIPAFTKRQLVKVH